MNPSRSRSRARRIVDSVIGVILTVLMLFPVYWMVNASLQNDASAANTEVFPFNPTLESYARAIDEQLGHLGISVLVATGTVILTLLVATPAAYALAKFKVRGHKVVTIALLTAQMVPGIVIANSLYAIYSDTGLLNSVPGLVLADATASIPFAILIMRAFMESTPTSLIEAARVDGASHFRAFWSIVIPISRNAIITAALFSFLFAWSDFVFALTLTTGNDIQPITLGIYSYLGASIKAWGPVLATSVIASIPAIVLLVVAQRYIAAGALGGALK